MKKTALITLAALYLALLNNTAAAQTATVNFKKLDWMAGSWKRTNTNEGQTGYENWVKVSDTAWQGIGITMQGKDTISSERLKIIKTKKHIYYIADVSGNPEPVWYQFTEVDNESFACENGEYDFPKRIEYRKNGKKIKATISGNGRFIDYLFKKQKE